MAEKPVLYYTFLSPPCRSVLLAAAALNVDLELKEVNVLAGEHHEPEFVKINPQQTIPFLDDNGIHIVDSHAICAYLSDKYGADDSLYPKDLAQRATVNSRLHFDSGNLFSNLRALFRPILYEKSAEMQEERISAVRSQWDTMEKILENGLYMCGNEMTIADLCCIATVSSLTEIATIDADKCPKLLEWIDRMSELPYYEEKNGAGSRTIQSVVLEVRQQNANALG